MSDREPLNPGGASNILTPATSQDMPSAFCTAHGGLWFAILLGIGAAAGSYYESKLLGMIAVAFAPPLLFICLYILLNLVSVSCTMAMQPALLQHPDYMLSRIVLPILNVIQGMQLCNNAFCQELRAKYGNNYCFAGMVSISDYQVVEKTLKGPQARKKLLGAQPLGNLPYVDRPIFTLSLANLAPGSDHNKFVACFKNYAFGDGFTERKNSAKTKKFWDMIVQDYKSMPHGQGEQFFSENATGLRGFFIRYFFWVMFGLDTEDQQVMDTLLAMMGGDVAIALGYLAPFAYLGAKNSAIRKIDDLILASPAMANFKEGDPKFANMTKLELARSFICITRLAAITGTLQLATTVTGGLGMPAFEGMDKIDIPALWDKLNLNDVNACKNFCLEVGRLFPPVSSVHHVSVEAFSTTIGGKTVDFPAGTPILVPTNLPMTDKNVWGVDAFKFDANRKLLQEKNMVFANVGPDGTRVCPGMNLALDTCAEILQVLGKTRRS